MNLRFWPFHRHRWQPVWNSDRIALYRCPCGRSKTRIRRPHLTTAQTEE